MIKLSYDDILSNWHNFGTAWLQEDPNLFKNNEDAFEEAIMRSDDLDFLYLMTRIDTCPYLRCCVADKHILPENIIREIAAEYPHTHLMALNLASNWSAPPDILERIYKDRMSTQEYGDERIFAELAENPKTPLYILESLVTHEDEYIRMKLARNVNTPLNLLETLVKDEDEDVRSTLAAWSIHDSILFLLMDDNKEVRISIAENLRAPEEVFLKLSLDSSVEVKKTILENSGVTIPVLEMLSKDTNQEIRNIADYMLKIKNNQSA